MFTNCLLVAVALAAPQAPKPPQAPPLRPEPVVMAATPALEAVVAAPKKAVAPKACPCGKCKCDDKGDCPAGCPTVITKAPTEPAKAKGEGWSCGPTGCVFTPRPEGEGWQWHTEGRYWWRFASAAPSLTSAPAPAVAPAYFQQGGCANGQCGGGFVPAYGFPAGGCANGSCGVGFSAPSFGGGCANGSCGAGFAAPQTFRAMPSFGGGGCPTCR